MKDNFENYNNETPLEVENKESIYYEYEKLFGEIKERAGESMKVRIEALKKRTNDNNLNPQQHV